MHNVLLIARREYMERVRTRGFLLATVLIPLLMGSLIVGSMAMVHLGRSQAHVAVVTADAALGRELQEQLGVSGSAAMKLDVYAPDDTLRAMLDAQLRDRHSTLAGYLWIVPGVTASERPAMSYHARSAGDIATQTTLQDAVRSVLLREQLAAHGVNAVTAGTVTSAVHFDTSAGGSSGAAFMAAYLFFFLMYMTIMLYGMNTARSIIDEKTSRIFEVLLATIEPETLLAGKILGVGAVGLTQVSVWMLGALAVANSGMLPIPEGVGHSVVSPAQIGYFVLYFIFGFLIYSSIAAGLGAMTNSEQELQQLNLFLLIPLIFCIVMIFPIMRAPDSTLARVVSLIPFCSPLLMNFRLSLTRVPTWEIWLSIALMSVTIVAILSVSAKIYRVGILMYGKKPSVPEMLRWLRYS